jgi:hypothetical protein
MVIVTDASLSLLLYHIEMCRYEGLYPGKLEVNIEEEGGYLEPVVRVKQAEMSREQVTAIVTPPNLTLFISCSAADASWPGYLPLKPELYKGPLDRLTGVLTKELRDQLWNTHKHNLRKLNGELCVYIIRYNGKLIGPSSPGPTVSFFSLIGTAVGSKLLQRLNDNELYRLLVGPPDISDIEKWVQQYPTEQNYRVLHYWSHMRDDFLAGRVALKPLAIAFNEGVRLKRY